MVLVAEAGLTHIQDMPDKFTGGPNDRGLRFNGPGTNVSGNYELRGRHCPTIPTADCLALNLVEPQNRFADATSYGYRVAGRLEYPGLMGPWNVLPRFNWQHDVKGTTPGPGRQLRRRPLRPHARCRREPAGDVGARHGVDEVRRRRPLQRPQRSRLRRGHASSSRSDRDEGNLHAEKIRTARLAVVAGLALGAPPRWRPCRPREAAKLGAELTPLGAEKAGNADGSIPAWDGGITSAAQAGFRQLPSRPASPRSVRERQAAVHGHARRTWASTPSKLTEGHKKLLQTYKGTFKMIVYPDASQRRLPAAHLRRDQAHRDHRAAREGRQRRHQRRRGHSVPDSEARRRGVLESRAALSRRRHRAPDRPGAGDRERRLTRWSSSTTRPWSRTACRARSRRTSTTPSRTSSRKPWRPRASPVKCCWCRRRSTSRSRIAAPGSTTPASAACAARRTSPSTIPAPTPTTCAPPTSSTCTTAARSATTGSWSARRKCSCRTTATS